jgi:hypothetical protein
MPGLEEAEVKRKENERRRGRTVVAGVAAVCALTFGGAAAVGAITSGDEDAHRGLQAEESKEKDWQLVAQTQDQRFGAVEFYRAEVAGDECFGYRLVEQDRVTGGKSIYHSCGDAVETLDAGWLRKEGDRGPTLVHGWVSDEVDSVVLRAEGQPSRELPLVTPRGDVRGKFFAASDPSALKGATVEARDAAGARKAARSSAGDGL